MRRPKLWIILVGAGFVLLATLLFATRVYFELGAERAVERLRAERAPTSSAELNVFYEPVSPMDNSALTVIQAIGVALPPQKTDLFSKSRNLPAVGEPWAPDLREQIKQYLARNKKALKGVQRLHPGMPARYPIDLNAGPATLLPHLANLRSIVLLLKFEAIDAALDGEKERATAALLAGLTAAQTLRDEPLVVSQSVRLRLLTTVIEALEHTLSAATLNLEQLARLESALRSADEGSEECIHRAFLGERAIALDTFDLRPDELEELTQGHSSYAFQAVMQLVRFTGVRAWDKRQYLELMEHYGAAASAPFPERMRKADAAAKQASKFLERPSSTFAVITRMSLPSLEATIRNEALTLARLRCARGALAVERFRLARDGKVPADFSDLEPEYSLAGLRDPFDNSALCIEPIPKGFRIRALAATKDRATSKSSDLPPAAFSVVDRTVTLND